MAKKQTTLKGLGPRYGIKIRKQFTQVHHLMKQKRILESQQETKIKRLSNRQLIGSNILRMKK